MPLTPNNIPIPVPMGNTFVTVVGEDGVSPVTVLNPLPTTATLSGNVTLDPDNLNLEATQLLIKTAAETLATNLPAKGQALAAASLPVVLTAAQIATLTPLTTVTANLGTIAGAATAANQTTGNTSLGSIVTALASQATAANQATTNTKLDTIISGSPASAQRTVTFSTVTSNGTVSAGARYVEFIFSSDFTGTVGGASFNGLVDRSIDIPAQGIDTLGSIAYTVTTGSIRIITY